MKKHVYVLGLLSFLILFNFISPCFAFIPDGSDYPPDSEMINDDIKDHTSSLSIKGTGNYDSLTTGSGDQYYAVEGTNTATEWDVILPEYDYGAAQITLIPEIFARQFTYPTITTSSSLGWTDIGLISQTFSTGVEITPTHIEMQLDYGASSIYTYSTTVGGHGSGWDYKRDHSASILSDGVWIGDADDIVIGGWGSTQAGLGVGTEKYVTLTVYDRINIINPDNIANIRIKSVTIDLGMLTFDNYMGIVDIDYDGICNGRLCDSYFKIGGVTLASQDATAGFGSTTNIATFYDTQIPDPATLFDYYPDHSDYVNYIDNNGYSKTAWYKAHTLSYTIDKPLEDINYGDNSNVIAYTFYAEGWDDWWGHPVWAFLFLSEFDTAYEIEWDAGDGWISEGKGLEIYGSKATLWDDSTGYYWHDDITGKTTFALGYNQRVKDASVLPIADSDNHIYSIDVFECDITAITWYGSYGFINDVSLQWYDGFTWIGFPPNSWQISTTNLNAEE